jgi:hypothetical protein
MMFESSVRFDCGASSRRASLRNTTSQATMLAEFQVRRAHHPRRVDVSGFRDGPDIVEGVAEGRTRSLVESRGARNLKALLRLENINRWSPMAI